MHWNDSSSGTAFGWRQPGASTSARRAHSGVSGFACVCMKFTCTNLWMQASRHPPTNEFDMAFCKEFLSHTHTDAHPQNRQADTPSPVYEIFLAERAVYLHDVPPAPASQGAAAAKGQGCQACHVWHEHHMHRHDRQGRQDRGGSCTRALENICVLHQVCQGA